MAGHTDLRVTYQFYTKAAKRRAKLSGAYLAEFDRALAWAALSTSEKAAKGSEALSGADREERTAQGVARESRW
jgi:hypothetical protein